MLQTPNWLEMKEPRDVRPVCDFILSELKGARGPAPRRYVRACGGCETCRGRLGGPQLWSRRWGS